MHDDQVRPAGAPEACLEPWGLGRWGRSDPSSRICSRWSSLGGPGAGEEAGGGGGRGRASVPGISAGWRERGVRSQPGRLFPQPGAERAAMALAGPGTPASRPLASLLLRLLLLAPVLSLLGGELGHEPWGGGGGLGQGLSPEADTLAPGLSVWVPGPAVGLGTGQDVGSEGCALQATLCGGERVGPWGVAVWQRGLGLL